MAGIDEVYEMVVKGKTKAVELAVGNSRLEPRFSLLRERMHAMRQKCTELATFRKT